MEKQISVSGKYIIINDAEKEKVEVYHKSFDNLVATLKIYINGNIEAVSHNLLFISCLNSISCIGFDGKFHWINYERDLYIDNMVATGAYLFVRYNSGCKGDSCTRVKVYSASEHYECITKPHKLLKSFPTKYKKHYYILSDGKIFKLNKSLKIVAECDLNDTGESFDCVYSLDNANYLIIGYYCDYYYNDNTGIVSASYWVDSCCNSILSLRDDYFMVSGKYGTQDISVTSLRYGKFLNVLPNSILKHTIKDIIKLDNIYRLVMTNETTFDIEIFKKELSKFHLFSKETRKRMVFLYWVLKKTFPKDLIECVILNAI